MSFKVNGELIPSGGGDNIPLIREKLTIGRRDTCDVCLKFPNISGLHAELSFKAGYWYIHDCNSTNGLQVNGVKVHDKLLQPRDTITIGKRDFVIKYEAPVSQMHKLEEGEDVEEFLGASLLERAGLIKPKEQKK